MKEREAVLAILAAEPVPGRTMLQKLVFLLAQRREEQTSFVAHYYGPYSSSVRQEMDDLVNQGLVMESVSVSAPPEDSIFDVRQYRYELTEAGRVAAAEVASELRDQAVQLVNTVRTEHAWSAPELSVAAKLVLMTRSEPDAELGDMPNLARKFGWRITDVQASRGARLVSALGLSGSAHHASSVAGN